MTRRSLRPQLNQIRTWVRQGRTDAWIAHQLEVTVQQIQAFKREQGLEPDGEPAPTEEVDLRAEDDEAIAAELEAEAARKAEEDAKRAEEEAAKAAKAAEEGTTDEDAEEKPRARRGRRGGPPAQGRARSRARSTTARRATACGWTPPSRTIRCTPSTGPATGPSSSRSRRTRS